jgi:hypothetical protein
MGNRATKEVAVVHERDVPMDSKLARDSQSIADAPLSFGSTIPFGARIRSTHGPVMITVAGNFLFIPFHKYSSQRRSCSLINMLI